MDSQADAVAAAQPRSQTRLILSIVIGLAIVAGVILAGRQAVGPVLRFAAWVEGLGAWGPIVFILGYVIATVAFLPGSVLTLAAGFIFGLVRGTLYTFIGATIGASFAFLIARYVARGAIERKIAGNPKFAAVDRAVGREGFKIVALLRLSPLFPFNLLNYSLGLTRVSFLQYLAASIAMLPGTLLYVYYGAVARKATGSLAAAASGAGVQKGAESWVFLGIGLVATLVVTTFVTRLAGRALRQQIDEPATSSEDRHA